MSNTTEARPPADRKYRRFVRALALGSLIATGACDSDDPAPKGDATNSATETEVQAVDGPLAPPDMPV